MLEKKSDFLVNFVPFFVNKIGQTCDVSETLPSEHFLTVDIVVLLYKIIKNSSSYTVKCVSYAENSFICLSQNICLDQKRPHHFAVILFRFPLISKINMMETFNLSQKNCHNLRHRSNSFLGSNTREVGDPFFYVPNIRVFFNTSTIQRTVSIWLRIYNHMFTQVL